MMVVTLVDEEGRKTLMNVPNGAPEKTWDQGILIGPPDLSSLGLGEEITIRLHNELFHRGIIRRQDARSRRSDVHAALMAALRVDAERIIATFEENGNA